MLTSQLRAIATWLMFYWYNIFQYSVPSLD